MIYPNFMIVGAAKSGTTSLCQYLSENEEVFMPVGALKKEPGFFSDIRSPKNMDLEKYLRVCFSGVNDDIHKRIGEASTAYLTDPGSAKNIYDFNPNTKIIIILRNPINRAYSLYNWMVQEGYEYAASFEKAIELEKHRVNKKIPNYYEPEYYYNYLYFNSGLYYKQVKRYLDLFGENVLIVKFSDFKNNLDETYKRICLFLDIKVNAFTPAVYNISKDVYSPGFQFLLKKINQRANRTQRKLFSIKTKASRDRIVKLGLKKTRPKAMKIETRKLLIKKYESDIELLSKLTNIDYRDWNVCEG